MNEEGEGIGDDRDDDCHDSRGGIVHLLQNELLYIVDKVHTCVLKHRSPSFVPFIIEIIESPTARDMISSSYHSIIFLHAMRGATAYIYRIAGIKVAVLLLSIVAERDNAVKWVLQTVDVDSYRFQGSWRPLSLLTLLAVVVSIIQNFARYCAADHRSSIIAAALLLS